MGSQKSDFMRPEAASLGRKVRSEAKAAKSVCLIVVVVVKANGKSINASMIQIMRGYIIVHNLPRAPVL